MTHRPIRLLIVDDSALVRKMLADSLSQYPEIEVVGSAIDPIVARDKILKLNPDVLTLDIEMPRMDGLTVLKLIMKSRPMPVMIIHSLTSSGSVKALEASQAGAVDVLAKPHGSFSAYENGAKLAEKIKIAAAAKLRAPRFVDTPGDTLPTQKAIEFKIAPLMKPPSYSPNPAPPCRGIVQKTAPPLQLPVSKNRSYSAHDLILLGASTGGTEALKEVLNPLFSGFPRNWNV